MRYFIELSYSGTNFHGWQSQANALGIQEVLEEKLSMILKEKTAVTASGRTDTGVHAKQQIAHFDTSAELTEDLLFRINCMLPHDIAINSFRPVNPDCHARFDALYREYEYYITTIKDPFARGRAWQFTKKLDFDAMNEAAGLLLKYSDFESFSKVHTDVKTFNCTVMYAQWERQAEHMILFRIRANRFLRGMVRAIVGTLVDIGTGKKNVADFEHILLSRNRGMAGAAAPPEGLFLAKIGFPQEVYL